MLWYGGWEPPWEGSYCFHPHGKIEISVSFDIRITIVLDLRTFWKHCQVCGMLSKFLSSCPHFAFFRFAVCVLPFINIRTSYLFSTVHHLHTAFCCIMNSLLRLLYLLSHLLSVLAVCFPLFNCFFLLWICFALSFPDGSRCYIHTYTYLVAALLSSNYMQLKCCCLF